MFLALGCGLRAEHLFIIGAVAAIFHLVTLAFFQALLFLAAGSVMHAMGNVIDMRQFSGLRKVLPVTHITFLCGALALAGFPLLSGFWSKDDILAVALAAGQTHETGHVVYLILFGSALVTAALTAFYTFRAYFMTFWGETRIPPEAGHHAHESPPVMTVPLMILAAGAVGVGIVVEPFTHWFSGLMESKWMHHAFGRLMPHEVHEHGMNLMLMSMSGLVAIGGIAVAWWMYVRQPGVATRLAKDMPVAYELSYNKFFFDELYVAFVVKPMAAFAVFCRVFDLYVVDGLVDLTAQVPRYLGYLFRPIQNGLVQFYALAMVLGLSVFLLSLLLR
jgi:NADH-quinone oxidoreductase subunit L